MGARALPADQVSDALSKVFAAMADPIRRDMVARLAEGDATVGELAAPHDVTKQAVSKHLRVLEDAGLVSRTGDAYRRPVHLEAEVLDLMAGWIERYRRRAEERYQRLDAVLAAMPDDTTRTGDATHPEDAGGRPPTTTTTPRRRGTRR